MKAISVSVNRFLLAAALLLAGLCLLFTSANEALAQACPGADDPPTPTEVAVTAAPIVVESTTSDYFVLYASHDLDGETVWYPVKVTLGEDGTTTLAENVAPLAVERYRVEKYSIADPADVDSDCTDDITELNSMGSMNPVNPGVTMELTRGAVSVPDRETFEALAHPVSGDVWYLKVVIADMDTGQPKVYFLNASNFSVHTHFLDDIGAELSGTVRGLIVYDPELLAPDGSRGAFRYRIYVPYFSFNVLDLPIYPFNFFARIHTLIAASMPLLDDDLSLWIPNQTLTTIQADLPLFHASRINLLFDEDINNETSFVALIPGEGYGLLRKMDPDERPSSRDVVIYEALPNELPRVAGIITTVPQTPLSHVNLRALQDNVPNAFVRDALEDDAVSDLIGSYVYYAVTETGYSIRAATQAEVDAHYAASRPAEAQTPERDLSVTSITPLSQIAFDDWDSFGVKAANVAVLRTLGFPEGTVPNGFGVPFYFYDEFMKHNDLYDYIEEMLEDSDFQSDYDTKADELKKLRKKIKKAETPNWIETALTAMHATFPEDTSLRYRSSTNNEDLPNFNGAGLYDSKTQHPEETEEDGISKSLKQVYASLWNFRAFIERDFHRIDHMAAAMGVPVHPNYSDERVNGVAVSVDPAYGTEGTYYVNSQVGEDLVTNPEAHSVPEEVLLFPDGAYSVVALSNQVPAGQLLMSDDQLGQLRRHSTAIHERFAELYDVDEGERFAMEVEFKITSANVLSIKQARPWIFADPPPAIENARMGDTGPALTASLDIAPATHDGNPFSVRVRFSENPAVSYEDFIDHAVSVTGGRVTNARRVDGRQDWRDFHITPDSYADVTIVLAPNIPCTIPGAICSLIGRRLSTRLEHTVESLLPRVPDRPTWRGLSPDSVSLGWNDAARADSYEVQLLQNGQWAELPASGIVIAFDGASAVISGLSGDDVYSFRVRAVNSYGASEWSDQQVRLDWESQLTPGRNTNLFPVESGYARFGNLGGTLSPDEFVLNGTTYKVQFLVHWRESLWLGTSPELPADFTLFVGNSDYRGRESKVSDTTVADAGYWWPSAPLDWSADDPVPVGLLMHPWNPLGDRQNAPVTGHFRNYPPEHDGNAEFSFRIYFSEGVTTTADALRDHVLSVSGGTVSGVEAVGSEGRIWAVSVTPESHHPVTVGIEADLDCQSSAAICAADGRRLFNRMELTVQAVENSPATGAPTITGTVEVGEILIMDTSDIADANGLTRETFTYQWVSYDGHAYTDIPGATDSTYTLLPTDEGKAFRVRVSFNDYVGYEESLTSALARSERPYGLNASESDGAVTLTWRVPAGRTGSTFQILRNRPELGETEPVVHVRFAQTNGATYTDTDVEPGVLYVYRVKGVDPFGYPGEASQPFEIRTEDTGAAPARPNVVIILADDLGWGDIQTNNPNSAMTTPHIDGIAAAGAYFTDAHSPSSVCSPTRYGLLTGRYAWRSWLARGTLGIHDRPLIGPDRPTLGTLLQGHGYRTAAIGKWHLGMDFARLSDVNEVTDINRGIDFDAEILDGPTDHGFDEFFGTSSNLNWRPQNYIRDRRFLANPDREGQPASGFYAFEDVLDRLTEEAVSFIERSASTEAPFFLYLPVHTPHTPLAPNDQFDDLTGLGEYADVVAQLDWTVGQVLDALDRIGASDGTLVIFTSDNGSFMGGIPVPNHADHASNGIWRGGKFQIHEGGHRVPFLMQWPEQIEAGSTVDATVSLTDLYATLAEVVGEEPEPGVAPDSVSLLPLLRGETETRGVAVVHHAYGGMFAIRDGRWKLVFGEGTGGLDSSLYLPPSLSPATFSRPWQLYDLEEDPGEQNNLVSTHPEEVERLEAALHQIRSVEGGTLSGDATLRSLRIAGIDIGPFTPDMRTYAATVVQGIETVRVTAHPTDTDARVAISTPDGRRLYSAFTYGRYPHGQANVGLSESNTTIMVTVTAPDGTATADYTVTLARPPGAPKGPSISGTAEVGETLMVDTSVITDPDGLTGATFTYQWVSYDGNADADIQGATDSTYTLVPADAGKAFRVRVLFTDDAGNRHSLTSALARSDRPYGLNASESDGAVALTWRLPVGWTGSTFRILRNRPELGETEPLVHVRFAQTNGGTYTDTDVEPGVLYVYQVKKVDPFGYPGEASRPFEIRTAASSAPSDTPLSPARGSRPNVVIILADDLGWGDIQTNNPDSAMTTPHIDSIAAAGAYFTDAHTPSSVCSPTRYGLLTGRYSWRSWLRKSSLNAYDRPLIGPDRPTLGTMLQGHGYRTAAIGKWHLGMEFVRLSDVNEVTEINGGIDFDAEIVDGPLDHGFDEFFGSNANLRRPPSVYIRDRRFAANPDREGRPASGFVVFHERLDRYTEEAVAFIEREGQTEAPFFLYLPVKAPHRPLAPNARFDGLTGLGAYADFVAQLDWTVGQVLDALNRVGARDDTLVIFTSDNGSTKGGIPVPNHADHQPNGGWKSDKGSIYEGGHRVPLLMQWPRAIEAGSAVDATVSLTDLYATLADIVGEEPGQGVALDSVSLLLLLSGDAVTRGVPVVHHSGPGIFALRDGRWKLVIHEPRELYDLEQDHGETNNVATAHPEVVARMEAALERIRAAEDGTLSADATLRSLNLAGIDIGPFDPGVRTYAATVARRIMTVEVTAIPTATDALVTISDADGPTERGHHQVRLTESATTITVTVIAPDTSATTTYIVTVGRGLRITGTPQAGQILTADTSGITDADGLNNAGYSYQWVRNDGSADSDIVGATGTSYLLAAEDEGKTIKIRVSFTDDGGNAETRTIAVTPTISYPEDVVVWKSELTPGRNTNVFPLESGYLAVGSLGGTLSPDSFEIDGTTYRVRNLIHASGSLRLGMDRELPADFTLIVGDSVYLGSESKVPPSTEGEAYWWPSAAPDWSADGPVRVGLNVYSGVAPGDRQKAPVTGYFKDHPSEHDGHEDVLFHIDFSEEIASTADALRDHVLSVSGGTVSGVEAVGSEGRTWAVSVTPGGHHAVTVVIEADLDCALPGAVCTAAARRLFNRMALRVEPREKNPASGLPTISGTVEPRQTLTADTSGIADADGLTGAAFTYQWVSYDGNADTDIQGATDSTYTLIAADEGKAFRVRASFTDDAGNKQSLTSALARSERPYGLNATESDGAVTLTWNLPAGWTGSTFRILRNRPELGETEPQIHVRYIQTAANTDTDTDVEPGVLYVYRVKGVDPFGYTGEASRPVEIRTEEATPVENSPPTGLPTISGAAQVDETVTVGTSGIADADGLTGAIFSYQWLADGTNIRDATGSSYTLAGADKGKAIKVRVTFTDDAGNAETLTSEATASVEPRPNSPATGSPTISGTAEVTETLTADTSGIADPDGLANAAFLYQWLADDADISGATGSTYTLADADVGKTITVRVSFTDDAGNGESLTSETTPPVESPPNSTVTGSLAVSGSIHVGETLTVDTSGIADEDGLTNAAFSYRWLADDGIVEMQIAGATDSTYTLSDDDAGKTIVVRVAFTDDRGTEETLTSASTETVTHLIWSSILTVGSGGAQSGYSFAQSTGVLAPGEFSVGVADFIVGTLLTGSDGALTLGLDRELSGPFTLHAGTVSFAFEDAQRSASEGGAEYTYRWDQAGLGWSAGERVSLRLTTPERPLTAVVEAAPGSHDGQNAFTFELRFSEEPGLSYKTLRDHAFTVTGGTVTKTLRDHAFTVTGGTVTKTLRLEPGKNVRWEVTVRPNSNADVAITLPVTTDCSDDGAICTGDGRMLANSMELRVPGVSTIVVEPTPQPGNSPATGPPSIRGAARVGTTLRASLSDLQDADGLSGATFSYQWLADGTEIQGATDSIYVVDADNVGKSITVRVSFTDDEGYEEALTSAPAQAAPNSPATGTPAIIGTAQAGQTLTADTSGIADADGLTGATFTYQWVSYDGNADADIQGATDSTYTLVPADAGKAFRVRVLFTDDAGNSHSLTSPLARSDRPYGLNASESDGAVVLTWRVPVGWTGSTFQILRNRPELGETEPPPCTSDSPTRQRMPTPIRTWSLVCCTSTG